jgi:predicted ABC-type ATPase
VAWTEKARLKSIEVRRRRAALRASLQGFIQEKQEIEKKRKSGGRKPKPPRLKLPKADSDVMFGRAEDFVPSIADLKSWETLKQHFDPTTGKMTLKRQNLHRNLVAKNLTLGDTIKPRHKKGQRTFHMTGGGSAAGKGNLRKMGLLDVDEEQVVVIDSDEIKKQIPETVDAQGSDSSIARKTHEESSVVAKMTQKAAFELGMDVLLDGTGDSETETLRKKLREAHKAGYKVVADYVSCDWEAAFFRSDDRYNRGEGTAKRYVPHSTIATNHRNVSRVVSDLVGEFDELTLWDSNGPKGTKPTKIATFKRGVPDIFDHVAYMSFLEKASANVDDLLAQYPDIEGALDTIEEPS